MREVRIDYVELRQRDELAKSIESKDSTIKSLERNLNCEGVDCLSLEKAQAKWKLSRINFM